jgi:hypothetical protein
MGSIDTTGFNIEQLRERLRSMSDDELLKFGKSAKSLCDPSKNFGRPPREVFVIQLGGERGQPARD